MYWPEQSLPSDLNPSSQDMRSTHQAGALGNQKRTS
jgi:hypothetical protein